MSFVPSKAKQNGAVNGRTHGTPVPPRRNLLGLLKDFIVTLTERSMYEVTRCTFCEKSGDRGTFVAIARVEGSNVEETHLLCSTECLLDYVEKELIDDRVDRAIRDERVFLHELICPACKRRVRTGIEDGELEAPS